MKFHSQTPDDDGGFSIAFGDMIFGLLFFFFILSLIMVFNKPEVKKYHQEIDKLTRQLNLDDPNSRGSRREFREQSTLDENVRLKKDAEAIGREYNESLKRLELDNRGLEKKLKHVEYLLGREKIKSRRLVREVKASTNQKPDKDLMSTRSEIKGLLNTIEQLEADQDNALRREERLKERLWESQNVLSELSQALSKNKKFKSLLKKSKLPELLAMTVEEEKEGDGKKEPSKSCDIKIRLFSLKNLDMRADLGDKEIFSGKGMSADEVVAESKKICKQYKDSSEDKKDRTLTRILVMPDPEIAYGSVQEFLGKIKSLAPTYIVR